MNNIETEDIIIGVVCIIVVVIVTKCFYRLFTVRLFLPRFFFLVDTDIDPEA